MDWIPVKERLPKNGKTIIVWNKKLKRFREDYYINSDGMSGFAGSRQDEISHWMPIGLFYKMIAKSIPK